eukprot:GGOE01022826.1.p1 GENE.GGOE01022826.1~~GGOE01022826.1.p1  ORF type:complete len:129 (+),score=0.05 GGOE01022826.1:36-389(+)
MADIQSVDGSKGADCIVDGREEGRPASIWQRNARQLAVDGADLCVADSNVTTGMTMISFPLHRPFASVEHSCPTRQKNKQNEKWSSGKVIVNSSQHTFFLFPPDFRGSQLFAFRPKS